MEGISYAMLKVTRCRNFYMRGPVRTMSPKLKKFSIFFGYGYARRRPLADDAAGVLEAQHHFSKNVIVTTTVFPCSGARKRSFLSF